MHIKISAPFYSQSEISTLDKGYEALNWLIDQSAQTQTNFQTRHSQNSLFENASEFYTIKFKTARQCGHTSLLVRLAYERFKKVIIVTPISRQQTDIRKHFMKLTEINHPRSPVTMAHCRNSKVLLLPPNRRYYFASFCASESLEQCRGYEAEAILVDCASSASENDIENIYQNLGPCMKRYSQKFFVFFQ